jgi:hypothetical protein
MEWLAPCSYSFTFSKIVVIAHLIGIGPQNRSERYGEE